MKNEGTGFGGMIPVLVMGLGMMVATAGDPGGPIEALVEAQADQVRVVQAQAQPPQADPQSPAPDEAYPGQSSHAKPPDGWTCEHQNLELTVPVEHSCSCERHCDENGKIVEDQKCQVWCWADACKCGMSKGAAASCQ